MVIKEKLKKALKITGIVLLIIFFVFIISTSVMALNSPKDINFDTFINQVYVSEDLEQTIKFTDKNSMIFTAGKKVHIYKITDIEKDIILINAPEQDFAIKLIDNSKIYCEKTKQFMYLGVAKEGKNED